LQIPYWAIVSLGAWLLFRLGWGVLTFRDTREAYDELMGEIEAAKKDLRAKGIDVD
jgi:dolichol-phosphate mannosyltransferase subunit 3